MSSNSNLLYIHMPPLRRSTSEPSGTAFRTLGTSRSNMKGNSNYTIPTTRAEARKSRDDVAQSSLRLKDITRFDLMSPYVVQQLTGNFRSSFPTVAGKQRAINVQLPKTPYSSYLPKLALTNVPKDFMTKEARSNSTNPLTRSQSELTLYRGRPRATEEPNRVHGDRPHTEGRLTRRPQDSGTTFAVRKTATIAEDNRSLESDSNSGDAEDNLSDKMATQAYLRGDQKTLDNEGKKDFRRSPPSPGTNLRIHLRSSSRKASRHSAKERVARTADDKMASLTMSEYTEVHANNRLIKGQVWNGDKPNTAPEQLGSRAVRFNTSNDIFEYNS